MSFDGGLQPERTSLAWRRTGLVGVVATIALARAAVMRGVPAIAILCGALGLAAALTLVQGTREHDPIESDQAPGRVLPLAAIVTVSVTVIVGGAGVGLVLTT